MGSPYIDKSLQEDILTPDEMTLRDMFVTSYLADYDAYAATLRIGFHNSCAPEYARMFLSEPYVRRQIAIQEQGEEFNPEDPAGIKWIVNGLKKQASDYGPSASHGARVSALSQLVKVYGLDKTKGEEDLNVVKGGVMLVPAMSDPNEWQKISQASQAKLKERVKE